MFYKRKFPAVSFSPYACFFTAWQQGSDNVHGTDFELYSTLGDAANDDNKYTFCNFGTGRMAFGDCGPTGSVTNNEIGAFGTSGRL